MLDVSNCKLPELGKECTFVKSHAIRHAPSLDRWEQKQIRFPKSKKKRIRRKWVKRGYNFRSVFGKNMNVVISKVTGDIFMSSAAYDAYLKGFYDSAKLSGVVNGTKSKFFEQALEEAKNRESC